MNEKSNKIELYGHAGSMNHGCEAIVRGTQKVLGNVDKLWSSNPQTDYKYGLDKLVNIVPQVKEINPKSFLRYYLAVKSRIFNNQWVYYKEIYKPFLNGMDQNVTYLSIGGDHYCYGPISNQLYAHLNSEIQKKNNQTILWGCSIEPKDLNDDTVRDLQSYKLVITRESLSYNALLDKRLTNVKLIPDVAFQLDPIYLDLPKGFVENNTVGLNVSPLIFKYADKADLILKNYETIISYILKETNMSVALIPHVVEIGNDDREVLRKLKDMFENEERVVLIDDHSAQELKGFIARCRFFIGARTHATIAAYSTCVPTLVLGYSIKAKGIAKDLFNDIDHFVLPVQQLNNNNDLLNKFMLILNNEDKIRQHLEDMMPDYKDKVLELKELV